MQYHLISSRIPGLSVVQQILMNRGIAPADVGHYLNTSDADLLDPLLLDNMAEGAKLLISHIEKGSNIYVQVDCDYDGYASSALFINYLHKLFPAYVEANVSYGQHEGKQHGIELNLIPDNVQLVIVPDGGTNDKEQIEILANRGVDILILDHHVCNGEPSSAACIINNQICDYPNKSLPGVGIVYKFCCYLDSIYETDYASDYLDLVSTGIISDMMLMRDFETRHLVAKGLSNPTNPLLVALMEKNEYQLKGELTPHGVSWFIAPAINAIIRSGTGEEKDLAFEVMLDFHAFDLVPSTKRGSNGKMETKVDQACRNCANVRNRQSKERDSGLDYIDKLIAEQDLNKSPLLVVCLERDDFNPNIIGLMANQVAAKYNKPTLILRPTFDEEGARHWQGSGRNIKGTDFASLQEYLLETGLVEFCQGHDNAFGVSVADEQLQEFRETSARDLSKYDFSAIYQVDIEEEAAAVSPKDILSIGELYSVWGDGVEEPLVKINGLKITKGNLSLLKGNTIKITEGEIAYMLFKASEEALQKLIPGEGYVIINLIGKCSCNIWGGNITPQIIIEDFEVVQKCSYYF